MTAVGRSWLMVALMIGQGALSLLPADDPSVIYLVRHAETEPSAQDPGDPPLSSAGEARAQALARTLADTGLASVHSTNLRRTRETATPVATAAGLEIQIYDPFDAGSVEELLTRVRTEPGGHLIVGHSNTTPELVRALGGDPLSAIAEAEYDRLYVVSVIADSVTSVLLRYGPRHEAAGACGGGVKRTVGLVSRPRPASIRSRTCH